MKWLYKLEYKMGRFCIKNLMMYIIIGQAMVFLFDIFYQSGSFSELLTLTRDGVFSGQVWRLITFIFVPNNVSPLLLIFELYLYYLYGTNLENSWGSFLFNAYYLIGMIMTIVAALIVGFGIALYLNMSIFFAFAILFPDFELMLFFVLRVKVKYLAIIGAIVTVILLILSPWQLSIVFLGSMANLALFFSGTAYRNIKNRIINRIKYSKTRKNFNTQTREWKRNQKNQDRH